MPKPNPRFAKPRSKSAGPVSVFERRGKHHS
jgi:hypothetical protein